MEAGDFAEELPLGAVVGEDHVLAVVADFLGDDASGAVGEVGVKGFEKGSTGGGGGGYDDAAGAHLEEHDGAVVTRQESEGGVGHGADEGKSAQDGEVKGPWREGKAAAAVAEE